MAVINSSYTRFLKQSIIIVQGVIVCLYVIQFTRYRHRSWRSFPSAANFYILAHLVELVKNFFQVFSKFFFVPVALPSKRFITQPFYDITSTSFCQEVFSQLFEVSDSFGVARKRLAYISIPPPICQALFYKFHHSFLWYFTNGHLSLLNRYIRFLIYCLQSFPVLES